MIHKIKVQAYLVNPLTIPLKSRLTSWTIRLQCP